MNLLQNFHLAVIEYLYRWRRAVPMQTFTTRHSIAKCKTTKFGKITQNKGHFAVQPFKVIEGHRFWYQL